MKVSCKEITKEEVLNNKFCKYDNYTHRVRVITPVRQEALKMHKRTLCLFIASSGLKFRDIDGCLENANSWLKNRTKKEIIDLLFPLSMPLSLNNLF